jgi:hypothetical protein
VLLHWVPGLGQQLTKLLAAIHARHLHPMPLTAASFAGVTPQRRSLGGDWPQGRVVSAGLRLASRLGPGTDPGRASYKATVGIDIPAPPQSLTASANA